MFLYKKSNRKSAFLFHSVLRGISKFISSSFFLASILLLAKIGVSGVTPGSLDLTFDGDGKVFTSFPPLLTVLGNDVAVQTDGKIVMAGSTQHDFMFTGGFSVARFNADGTLDTTFDFDGKVTTAVDNKFHWANSVVIQPDGKIIVAGVIVYLIPDAYDSDVLVMRYNPDGSLDTTFDGDGIIRTLIPGNHIINDVALQPDGKIVVAGYTNGIATLVRYNPNGSLDTSFSKDGIVINSGFVVSMINAIAIQADGKIVAAAGRDTNWLVLRYNTDGSLDTGFDGDGIIDLAVGSASSVASGIVLQPDGKILTVGTATVNAEDITLIRFNPNGTLDNSFDGDGKVFTHISGSEYGMDLVLQPNGKIVAVGHVGFNSNNPFAVARYNADGSLDTTFNDDGIVITPTTTATNYAGAVALQANGRILVTGTSRENGSVVLRYIADRNPLFDFDGDRKTDISIFRPSNGEWWYLKSSNGGNAAFQFGNSSDKLVPGDYTGDGKTDIAIYRAGEWFVLRSENNSYYSHPFGLANDIPAPADFDGDGIIDEAVFRPKSSTWYINKSGGGTTIQQFGTSGDVPAVSDFDGDNRADIAIWRASAGQWWINRSTAGVIAFTFGTNTDKPVQGDYTGDGKDDVAIWRPSTGEWFILRSEDFSYYSFPFGISTDIPAPGDYDNDGKFDATVFRPSGSTWYVKRSTAGTLIQNFGIGGDKPVPNAFVP